MGIAPSSTLLSCRWWGWDCLSQFNSL